MTQPPPFTRILDAPPRTRVGQRACCWRGPIDCLPNAYLTSFKNTSAILKAIQAAQAPPRFTQKFLEGLGYQNSNDRAIINVLKGIGFLDDSGVPTNRYHRYLDQTQSALVLAEGIRDAYEDLFRINRRANEMSTQDVKNKMKTLSEGHLRIAYSHKWRGPSQRWPKRPVFPTRQR